MRFFEYLTYDSKKVYDIHNFIFSLVAVTVTKNIFCLCLADVAVLEYATAKLY